MKPGVDQSQLLSEWANWGVRERERRLFGQRRPLELGELELKSTEAVPRLDSVLEATHKHFSEGAPAGTGCVVNFGRKTPKSGDQDPGIVA